MKITKIAFVVLPVSDIARARKFYEDALHLLPARIFEKDGRGSIDYDLDSGRVTIKCEGQLPVANMPRVTVAFEVDNFNDVIASLRAHDTTFVTMPAEISGTYQATVNDPDGNNIVIYKLKGSSKKDFLVI
ncbi:putative enzyme related to lactoylglutathione lyase [Ereboglobus sp. PH5-5]|uniref:VOC family protein n=1 Tax=unclassified Ereboglobus TaxID=2626932 RepID=UPI002406E384|nr:MULTISPECIES: VOC family protein [unclassified Ereboglobus]MDF9826765.1 putative enzyme related to lactoylglutathione lyase [Ereboglobus sp. PH5-10]MDF9831812.1 putative enzyme related to lactoylglutathione lyase [Ereboglobus sp. PH5-5]